MQSVVDPCNIALHLQIYTAILDIECKCGFWECKYRAILHDLITQISNTTTNQLFTPYVTKIKFNFKKKKKKQTNPRIANEVPLLENDALARLATSRHVTSRPKYDAVEDFPLLQYHNSDLTVTGTTEHRAVITVYRWYGPAPSPPVPSSYITMEPAVRRADAVTG